MNQHVFIKFISIFIIIYLFIYFYLLFFYFTREVECAFSWYCLLRLYSVVDINE